MYIGEIRQEGGIWYVDINTDGPNKSLKTHAAKRRVPLHSELIRLGFLEWVATKPEPQPRDPELPALPRIADSAVAPRRSVTTRAQPERGADDRRASVLLASGAQRRVLSFGL